MRWFKKDDELTVEDRAIAQEIGLPLEILREVKNAGENLRLMEGSDEEGGSVKQPGVTVDVGHRKSAAVVRRVQELLPSGYVTFVSATTLGIYGKPDEVSVLKTSDPLSVISAMGTNGNNYGITCAMVGARVREWDQRFGLIILGCGGGWLQARFKNQPADMLAFAREVYEFCPDVVTQGAKTVQALAAEMTRADTVSLWWD
jgi:Domain of unknown function (DUF4253)